MPIDETAFKILISRAAVEWISRVSRKRLRSF